MAKKETLKKFFSGGEDQPKIFIGDSNSLIRYLSERAENHNSCKIYGEEDKLSAIFVERVLYLTDGKGWNDIADRDRFNCDDSEYRYYGKSFTYSKSENVAMWMLYGGMQKKGVMVEIGIANLHRIVENCERIVLGNFEGPTGKREFKAGPTIEKGDFSSEQIDVLYCSQDDGNGIISIKRSDEREDSVPVSCTENLSRVKKDFEWCYENEFRLIIKIPKELCEKYSIVKIDFGQTKLEEEKFYVIKSPNYEGEGRKDGIVYRDSTLKSKLDWNLCGNCKLKQCSQCNQCGAKERISA